MDCKPCSLRLVTKLICFFHIREIIFINLTMMISLIGMAPGCLLGGFIMQKYGRKFAHLLLCFPTILGWLAIFLANTTSSRTHSIQLLLAGRFLTGKQP